MVEYLRVSPVLSADSIFLYFAHAPRDGVRLRADYFPVGAFRFYVQAVADFYGTPVNSATGIGATVMNGEAPSPIAAGAGGGTAMRVGSFRVAADLTFKTGYGGRQIWLDVNGGYAPLMGGFSAEARLSVANITDMMNQNLRGTYVGVQLWGGYTLTRAARISMVLEQNFGPATRSDTKLFVLFDLKAVL